MDGQALVFSGNAFLSNKAKTAHGLVRGTDRYNIVGVIDEEIAGKDAGEQLDGVHRGIPAYGSLMECLERHPHVKYGIIGIATPGGKLPISLFPEIEELLKRGISVVSGLHEFLSEREDWVRVANETGAELIDVRKAKPRKDLHFWTGEIQQVKSLKIAVMGADCGIGKRTTARILTETLHQHNIAAEMIYTGQTGWLQGGKYGFILDSTLNDFVSGELEHAIVSCYHAEKPDVIIVEGQAALRNPSGPCGSEFLISGRMDGVILQYAPSRKQFKGWDHLNIPMPSVESEIELINMYGVPTLAISLNTAGMTKEEVQNWREKYASTLGIPILLPVGEGVDTVIPIIQEKVNTQRALL